MKKQRSLLQYRGNRCLNCDHPLDISDKYCPNCGQLNSTKKLSFTYFFDEFFAGLFAYDSRIRRTLRTLLFSPGKISLDYIRGKRMYYANPFRFYLSSSILFFIIWSFTNDFEGFNQQNQSLQDIPEEDVEQLREGLSRIPVGNTQINVDSIIVEQQEREEEREQSTYLDHYVDQKELDSMAFYNSMWEQFDLYRRFNKEVKISEPLPALDSLNHPPTFYNRWFFKKAVNYNLVEENPEIFISYFIGKLPFIIFFYLPVFALFIWLLYVFQPFNYMEHLIFTFHVQSTFFVIMGLAMIMENLFFIDSFNGIALLLFLFYLYKALRRFYGQGRFLTFVKFIILNGIFLILALIAALLAAIASFAIF